MYKIKVHYVHVTEPCSVYLPRKIEIRRSYMRSNRLYIWHFEVFILQLQVVDYTWARNIDKKIVTNNSRCNNKAPATFELHLSGIRKRSDSILWQKPLHWQKSPTSNVTTQKRHQKHRLHNDCGPTGRSVWVTIATKLMCIYRLTGSQPCHYPQKSCNQKDTHLKIYT